VAVELEGDEWVYSHGCLAPAEVDDEGGIILQVRPTLPSASVPSQDSSQRLQPGVVFVDEN